MRWGHTCTFHVLYPSYTVRQEFSHAEQLSSCSWAQLHLLLSGFPLMTVVLKLSWLLWIKVTCWEWTCWQSTLPPLLLSIYLPCSNLVFPMQRDGCQDLSLGADADQFCGPGCGVHYSSDKLLCPVCPAHRLHRGTAGEDTAEILWAEQSP